MASFYAELEVCGHTYPVRSCQFEFTQATNERGRVVAKVRHGLMNVALDVPEDDFLPEWGTTAHKPMAGHVTFFETDRRTARETVSFAAGQCVGYHESFESGAGAGGSYTCQLTIASPQFVLTAGGPLRPLVPAVAREYGPPKATSTLRTTPPGDGIVSDCTESVRQNLQNQVKQNCKNGKQSCLITDTCPVLEETMDTLNACIAARTKINMKCFKGGDKGHKLQIQQKINGLVNCQGYYFSKCKSSPQPVPVPKQIPSNEPTKLPAIPKEIPLTVAGVGLFILYLLTGALRPGPI